VKSAFDKIAAGLKDAIAMSWTQGIQPRDTLPEWFVKWADEKLGEPLICIDWDTTQPNIVFLASETFTARLDLTGTKLAV
jgi:hypothetical protein